MTQELSDLRVSIVEGRYDDAIAIIEDLEEMSKKAILRNIMSFLIRLIIHLMQQIMKRGIFVARLYCNRYKIF